MLDQPPQGKREAEAVIRLARLLIQYGLDERAFAVLKLADWLCPGTLESREIQASVLAKLGHWDETITLLVDLQTRRPATPDDQRLLARAYWAKGDTDKGNRAFLASFAAI